MESVNKIGKYNLRKKRFHFCEEMETDLPPYTIELDQEETISKWESSSKNCDSNYT